MITIKKINKRFKNRKIRVFDDNKKIGDIITWNGWFAFETNSHPNILRKVAIENLWWLLHSDKINKEYTELEAWQEKIEHFDNGKTPGVPKGESLFFEGEKEIALNSINNK